MNEHKQTDEGHLLRPQKPNPPPLLRRHRSMGHQTHADPYRFAVWRLLWDNELTLREYMIANGQYMGSYRRNETDAFAQIREGMGFQP